MGNHRRAPDRGHHAGASAAPAEAGGGKPHAPDERWRAPGCGTEPRSGGAGRTPARKSQNLKGWTAPTLFSFARPQVLGAVKVTADSFSDGGRYLDPSRAIEHGLRLREDGADFVDVGGESTRPGAAPIVAEEEMRRVMPVVEALVRESVAVSVDTMKPEVMRAAIAAGCAVVNDVNALRAAGAIDAVAGAEVGLIALHMKGTPADMQNDPQYSDVVAEGKALLLARAAALAAAFGPR